MTSDTNHSFTNNSKIQKRNWNDFGTAQATAQLKVGKNLKVVDLFSIVDPSHIFH